jgi:hypothetical protein
MKAMFFVSSFCKFLIKLEIFLELYDPYKPYPSVPSKIRCLSYQQVLLPFSLTIFQHEFQQRSEIVHSHSKQKWQMQLLKQNILNGQRMNTLMLRTSFLHGSSSQLVVAFSFCMRKFKMGCVIDSEDIILLRMDLRKKITICSTHTFSSSLFWLNHATEQ